MDVAFECPGTQKSVKEDLRCEKNDGTAVQIGMHPLDENWRISPSTRFSGKIMYKGPPGHYRDDHSLAINVDKTITDRFLSRDQPYTFLFLKR